MLLFVSAKSENDQMVYSAVNRLVYSLCTVCYSDKWNLIYANN